MNNLLKVDEHMNKFTVLSEVKAERFELFVFLCVSSLIKQ